MTLMRAATKYVLALLPLLAMQPSHAEHFYKWVDDAGATHYTQTPPPQKKAAKDVKVSTKLPADSEAASKNLAALSTSNSKASAEADKLKAEEQTKADADAARRKANSGACAQAQASVAQIETGQRLRGKDAKGDIVYLTEEQKAAKVQQQKTLMQQNCPK
jgi:hypothetical protein